MIINDQNSQIVKHQKRHAVFQRTGPVWIISISAMMRARLENVLDLIHMNDVTTAAVMSSRWHEDICVPCKSLGAGERSCGVMFAATVL